MAKYTYVAVFEPQQPQGYSVNFPDLEGCSTSAETLAEAITAAEDTLALWLYEMEEHFETIPKATAASMLAPYHKLIFKIDADTDFYRKYFKEMHGREN